MIARRLAAILCALALGWFVVLAVAVRRDRARREAKPVAADTPVNTRPVAHLGAWGVTEEGRRWGVVALPLGWRKGETILLLTENARKEVRP